MWRYLVGVAAGVLLVAGGLLAWQNVATAHHASPLLPARLIAPPADEAGAADDPVPEPPAATEKTREEKRFSRYDHDKDGAVSRDEFLQARRKNFAKLDRDGDGKLSFDEYAIKAEERFAAADADKSGRLTPREFTATKVQRRAKAGVHCPPARAAAPPPDDEGS